MPIRTRLGLTSSSCSILEKTASSRGNLRNAWETLIVLLRLFANPLAVHEVLFKSYIGNWRMFLRDRGSDFLRSVSSRQKVKH